MQVQFISRTGTLKSLRLKTNHLEIPQSRNSALTRSAKLQEKRIGRGKIEIHSDPLGRRGSRRILSPFLSPAIVPIDLGAGKMAAGTKVPGEQWRLIRAGVIMTNAAALDGATPSGLD